MKKYLLIALGFALCLSAGARGKIVTDSLYSNILNSTVKYNIYLPDGYAKASQQGVKFPSIYLLHGLSDNYTAWVKKGNMSWVADEVMETGESKKAVIIMPNAGDHDTHNIQSGYFNVENWNYEDFFFQEFIPAVEAKYNAIGDKQHRAIMGLSMGGGGSTVYAQHHPDMFSSCYAMSAWLDNTRGEVGRGNQKRDCLAIVCESVRQNSAIDFVRNADKETIKKLKTVRWFIDCGDDDFIFDYSVEFDRAMREARIPREFRVRNGSHSWEYWHTALRMALPFASQSF